MFKHQRVSQIKLLQSDAISSGEVAGRVALPELLVTWVLKMLKLT